MSDDYEIADEDIIREPFEADPKPRLSKEDLELLEGVMPNATRDNHEANHCEEEENKDDYDFDFEEDSLPTVPDLFPDWRDLFRKRPFLQLRRLGDGTPVILIGYGHQERANGSLKLDNSQVDGVLYRNLTSICAPHAKSNDTDSIGWKIKVIKAKEGMKLRCWTNARVGQEGYSQVGLDRGQGRLETREDEALLLKSTTLPSPQRPPTKSQSMFASLVT